MYNFIDVNEASESVVLPSEALKINGAYIEDQIEGYRTLSVSGREALSPDVETYTTGIRDGSRIQSNRYPERIITVRYQLSAESSEAFREAYNKLGGILNVEEAELIFNDEPDKFFIGTPCVIGAVDPGKNVVVGEFEILCTDPFKYSVQEYTAEPQLEESSILIDYNGTYKAFPVLEAEFYNEEDASEDGESVSSLTGVGDCGYVAFFNETEKIIQLGDPEEVDAETHKKSQTLVNTNFQKSNSWGSAAKAIWDVNNGITTSSTVQQAGTIGIGVASYQVLNQTTVTSSTLLEATSKAATPYIKYKIVAAPSNRTANSVNVTLSITASLSGSSSYWRNAGVLVGSVYIGGSWHDVTLKAASDKWNGNTSHTKNITVTVSGLAETANEVTGIKFKAYRNDSIGSTGKLVETACKDLAISQYVTDVPETYYLTPINYGSGENWHGPSITRVIPEDSAGEVGAKNFALSWSQRMAIGTDKNATSQCGAFQVLAVSGSGTSRKVVAGVNIYKGSSGKTAKLRFYVNNTVMETIEIDLSNGNKYFKSDKSSSITKTGKTVDFNICGIKKTYRDSEIADTSVTQVTFTFTKYGTKTPLSYNGLYWAKFVKNNCETTKDIPNKFSANDVVTADCRSGEIELNGVSAPHLGALGNDWEGFYLTPGLNQIGVAYSGWVEDAYAPRMRVRYREVFL